MYVFNYMYWHEVGKCVSVTTAESRNTYQVFSTLLTFFLESFITRTQKKMKTKQKKCACQVS